VGATSDDEPALRREVRGGGKANRESVGQILALQKKALRRTAGKTLSDGGKRHQGEKEDLVEAGTIEPSSEERIGQPR